jgi:hypothetical protein
MISSAGMISLGEAPHTVANEQEAAANGYNLPHPILPGKTAFAVCLAAGKGQIGIVVVENLIGQAVLPADR